MIVMNSEHVKPQVGSVGGTWMLSTLLSPIMPMQRRGRCGLSCYNAAGQFVEWLAQVVDNHLRLR